jgi:hypothetical protein
MDYFLLKRVIAKEGSAKNGSKKEMGKTLDTSVAC